MKEFSNIDYIYTVAGIILGLIMVTSPRLFLKKVKVTEESLKTESLLKKMGIVVIILSLILGLAIFFR